MGKLLEKIIETRLQEEIKGKISEEQYGFRQGRGTMDAVERVVKFIQNGLGKGRYVVGESLDIRNAFNSARWGHIVKKLKQMGVKEALVDIIKSYLQDRKAVMKIEGEKMEWEVRRGVPQGSVLGPTLWNVGFNEILKGEDEKGRVIYYAEDTLMLLEGKDLRELLGEVERRLDKIVNDIGELGLEIAPEKTELVVFTRKRKRYGEAREIKIKDQTIKAEKSMKYLGITLDEKLTFNAHIENAYGKTIRAMNRVGGKHKGKGNYWVAGAYWTVSTEAAEVISSTPPLKIVAKMRRKTYERSKEMDMGELDPIEKRKIKGRIKKEEYRAMMKQWQDRWTVDTGKAA
ncbi:PREDICTED: RNA-directed DNA polymerase from mobile element jockey-like [Habropoda laboriosa]|uniref:RNA-directed DNA polymerase from mobile element jockey-like n=1 Tax=Habropoda laboriosa TaxID=597456 RepID=UPI00083D988F|nr:PREDICTED: RNA-directed DNA polymerase from mobile element jockey-like [Habropoda laboriosa]